MAPPARGEGMDMECEYREPCCQPRLVAVVVVAIVVVVVAVVDTVLVEGVVVEKESDT